MQENVQLSKQVQDEVQRAGIDLQGGELSVRPGAKDVSPTDEVQDPKEMTGGFGAGCGAPDRTVAILAEGTHQTRQRPRPKSAGAVSESHWSKGTVVFTPALERASSGGVKVGEDLARSAEDLGRDPLVKKGHGRLTARIRELEAQLEEALSAQQVRLVDRSVHTYVLHLSGRLFSGSKEVRAVFVFISESVPGHFQNFVSRTDCGCPFRDPLWLTTRISRTENLANDATAAMLMSYMLSNELQTLLF